MTTSIKLVPIRYCLDVLSGRTSMRYIERGIIDNTFKLQSHFVIAKVENNVLADFAKITSRQGVARKKANTFKDSDADNASSFKCVVKCVKQVDEGNAFNVELDVFIVENQIPITVSCLLLDPPLFDEGCSVIVIGRVTSMKALASNQLMLSVDASKITSSEYGHVLYKRPRLKGNKLTKKMAIDEKIKEVLANDPNCPIGDLIIITRCSKLKAEAAIKSVIGRTIKEDIKSLKEKEQKPVTTKKPKGKHYLEVIREILTDNPDCKPSELMAMTGCTERCANSAIKGFKDEIEFTKDLYKVKPDRRY